MRTLDTSQIIIGFDGKSIEVEGAPITLKDVLIDYLRIAHAMGLSQQDLSSLFSVGVLVGGENKIITLETKLYDAMKRMVDKGVVKTPSGEAHVCRIEISGAIKQMIDEAPLKEMSGKDK